GLGCGALFRVDKTTGHRTLISDFGNGSQGPTGTRPSGIAINGGQILVTDPFAGDPFNGVGALFQVDATTGNRTMVSNLANPAQGPVGGRAFGVAFVGGDVLITEVSPVIARLTRVNLVTGGRSVVSDFTDPGQGPRGSVPIAVAPDIIANQVLVVEQVNGAGDDGF